MTEATFANVDTASTASTEGPAGEIEQNIKALQGHLDNLHNLEHRAANIVDSLWGSEPQTDAGLNEAARPGKLGAIEMVIRECMQAEGRLRQAVERLEQLS